LKYIDREKTPIIKLKEKKSRITFQELIPILREKVSGMIYVEIEEALYGIIGMGDIERAYLAGYDYVEINTNFTSLTFYDYKNAKKIFRDKEYINAIPILDKKFFRGSYVRWNNLISLSYLKLLIYNNKCKDVWKNFKKNLVFVNPSTIFDEKIMILAEWKNIFRDIGGVDITIVEHDNLLEFAADENIIVFADWEELRGNRGLYYLLKEQIIYKEVITYEELYEKIIRDILLELNTIVAKTILTPLEDQGVHILILEEKENQEGTLEDFNKRTFEKFQKLNIDISCRLLPEIKNGFLEGIYSLEYENQLLPFPYSVSHKKGEAIIRDTNSLLFNVNNGERLTVEQPELYERRIYMCGPCIIVGGMVEDKHTIASFLQKKINKEGYKCRVINLGVTFAGENLNALSGLSRIPNLEIKKGDIIVIDNEDKFNLDGLFSTLNYIDIVKEKKIPVTWVSYGIRHCNYKVNELFAEAIFDKLNSELEKTVSEQNQIEIYNSLINELYIKRYFRKFNPNKYKKIGAIVMNCNPFTRGHRYLIEEAIKKVDFLIIFVVEEEGSYFTFHERYSMVCTGVSDMENILVVPSGSFILSKLTFPEYFIKEMDEDIKQNTENDIILFAEEIASRLNIKWRFVGEEPEDNVTKEYNNAMKKILPLYGIKVIEIARKKYETVNISASYVRKCLEEGNIQNIDRFVPETTKHILSLSLPN